MTSVFGLSGGGETPAGAGHANSVTAQNTVAQLRENLARSRLAPEMTPQVASAGRKDGSSARFPAVLAPRRTEKARLAPCFSGSQTQPEKAEPAVRSRVQNPTGHSGGSKAGGLRRKKAARCWRGVCQADEKGSYETWLLKKKGGKEKKKKNQENQPTCRRTCAPRKYPLLGARWCSRLLFFLNEKQETEGDEQGTSHLLAVRETTQLSSEAQAMALGSSFARAAYLPLRCWASACG